MSTVHEKKITPLKLKISILIGAGIFLIISVLITYSAVNARIEAEHLAKSTLRSIAAEFGNNISSELNEALTTSRILMHAFAGIHKKDTKLKLNRTQVNEMCRNVLKQNDHLLGCFVSWEANAFDNQDSYYAGKKGEHELGEFAMYHVKDEENNIITRALHTWSVRHIYKDLDYSWYLGPKETKQEYLSDPSSFEVGGKFVLMTSLSTPYIVDNEMVILSGTDIAINTFQQWVDSAHYYGGEARIVILSAGKKIIGYNNGKEKLHGKHLKELFPDSHEEYDEVLKSRTVVESHRNGMLEVVQPFFIGKVPDPWYIIVQVPERIVLAKARQRTLVQVIIGVGLLVIGLFALVLLIQYIIQPISNLVAVANRISKGYLVLPERMRHGRFDDEITLLEDSFFAMADKFTEIVTAIKNSSDKVKIGSMQLTASAQQISTGANQQVSASEEVSAAMEQMMATIEQNTANSKQSGKIAEQAAKGIIEGKQAYDLALGAMNKIVEQISIIGEFAGKTDLLAVNAGIEAARAREHGKGFSFVASEVRKLAERSKTASLEIADLTNSSLETGQKSGKILEEVSPLVQSSSRLIQEIATASQEQNAGAKQISLALQQLTEVIHQNVAATEQLQVSSEEFKLQSIKLAEIISFFKITDEEEKKVDLREKIIKSVAAALGDIDTDDFDIVLSKKTKDEDKQDEEGEKGGVDLNLLDTDDSGFESMK